MAATAETLRGSVIDRYLARTPRSALLFERAARVLPGGSTRTTVYTEPYPPYIDHGRGAVVIDVDGNEYLDFLNNYTSLIHGHAHPEVVAAVEAQIRRGSAFAAPTELEVELAEELSRRVPSMERVRFTNSGTEATMLAIRLARACTNRDLIGRFRGAYHGTHDYALPGSPGVPGRVSELVVDLPFNDLAGVEEAIAGREQEFACIVIEPVQGVAGMIPAEPAFLAGLRELTRRHSILLVFDEVISFRVGPGGAQCHFGVTPDLTTLGKIIGGGYPVGAIGGRADLMARLDARRAGALAHGGSFNGNPVTAAAGLATLRYLTPERLARLGELGARLRDRLTAGFQRDALDAHVTGIASLFHLHTGARGPAAAANVRHVYLALLNAGFYTAPRGMGALSTPMDESDVDRFVDAALAAVRDALAEPDE